MFISFHFSNTGNTCLEGTLSISLFHLKSGCILDISVTNRPCCAETYTVMTRSAAANNTYCTKLDNISNFCQFIMCCKPLLCSSQVKIKTHHFLQFFLHNPAFRENSSLILRKSTLWRAIWLKRLFSWRQVTSGGGQSNCRLWIRVVHKIRCSSRGQLLFYSWQDRSANS